MNSEWGQLGVQAETVLTTDIQETDWKLEGQHVIL